jgi:hypothetical protein
MHARFSTRLTRVVIGAGLFRLGILPVLTLSDYLTRARAAGSTRARVRGVLRPGACAVL